jgi:hypothetical protein
MAYKTVNGKLVKTNTQKLAGFYWGYQADQGQDGFEFTHQHLVAQGQPLAIALEVGAIYKKAAEDQAKGVMRGDARYLEGKTQAEFIDEEFDRLLWVIEQLRGSTGKITLEQYSEYAMIACCAITTLVAAGRIPQDTWNGDQFATYKKTFA